MCTAGTHSKNHVCEKCPVGFYQDLDGQTSCKECPEGFTAQDVGLMNISDCNGNFTNGFFVVSKLCPGTVSPL